MGQEAAIELRQSWILTDHIILPFCMHIITLCLCLTLFAVNVILKERKSKDSITLAWQGPDRPNGVIVEYEVIYYEKVHLLSSPLLSSSLFFYFHLLYSNRPSYHPHTQITHMLLWPPLKAVTIAVVQAALACVIEGWSIIVPLGMKAISRPCTPQPAAHTHTHSSLIITGEWNQGWRHRSKRIPSL